MARLLKYMKVKEVSVVERGAGDGCVVILAKRDIAAAKPKFIRKAGYDPSEARDAFGRWMTGAAIGAAVGAGAAYARHATRGLSGLKGALTGAAIGLAATAGQRALDAGRRTRLKGFHPVKGGLRLKFETRGAKGRIASHLDVKPKKVWQYFHGLPPADAARAVFKPGSLHPTNNLPVVSSRDYTDKGVPIPLNHPGIAWYNAGGWPYRSAEGDYVPAGSSDQQKFIEDALNMRNRGGLLPYPTGASTPQMGGAGGRPYVTGSGDVVPAGSSMAQVRMEGRYALEHARVAAAGTHLKIFGKSRAILFAQSGNGISLFQPTRPRLFASAA